MRSTQRLRTFIALSTLTAVLVMAPFGVALGVHHELAAADHDGHQHSDFDLCQWVSYHGTSSPATALLDVGQLWQEVSRRVDLFAFLLVTGDPPSQHSPRGPPLA